MKILLTGGLGFVGSVAVRALCDAGHEVWVVDKGLFPSRCRDDRATYFRDDLVSVRDGLLSDRDVVCHFAGFVGEPLCSLSISESLRNNVEGTRHLCEVAKAAGVKRFVHISSCSVYGAAPGKVFKESDKKVCPADLYGIEKLAQEKIVLEHFPHALMYRLATVCGLSPCSMRADLVLNKFVAQAMCGQDLCVLGGSQSRPLVNVHDVARAVVFGVERKLRGLFNVVGFNTLIIDLANTVSAVTGCKVVQNLQVDDVRNYTVSNAKLLKKGFVFEYDLQKSIDDVKAWDDSKNWADKAYDRRKWMEAKK